MNAVDPSIYWHQIYSKDNLNITCSSNHEYFFFKDKTEFLFSSPRELLQKIAVSNSQQSCDLINEIPNRSSIGKDITIQEIIKFIKDANWCKGFDGENL